MVTFRGRDVLRNLLGLFLGLAVVFALAAAEQSVHGEDEIVPRAQFDDGVVRLRTEIDRIAASMKGVHGATYLAEVVTRSTGQYIAIVLRALANDPQSTETCDSVRRHLLRQLTGARNAEELEAASILLMERVFFARDPASKAEVSVQSRRLAAQTSVTVELSWRKCAGWLSDWRVVN